MRKRLAAEPSPALARESEIDRRIRNRKQPAFCGGMRRMTMRVPWPSSWASAGRFFSGTSSDARNKQGVQAAPEFLFEQGPSDLTYRDRTPGQPLQPGIRLVVSGQAPYRRSRREERKVSGPTTDPTRIALWPSTKSSSLAGESEKVDPNQRRRGIRRE